MASKQDPAKAGDDRAGVPDNVRQAAESALAQAKKAVDQCMQQATRLQETVGSSAQVAQAGARSVNQKVLAAAEANISATFDFAQRLVHATNAQEIVALQHEFVKQQLERVNAQLKEVGAAAKDAATEMGAAVLPRK